MKKRSVSVIGYFLIVCGIILGLGVMIVGEFIWDPASSVRPWVSYYAAWTIAIICLVTGMNLLEQRTDNNRPSRK
jgi:fucose permease